MAPWGTDVTLSASSPKYSLPPKCDWYNSGCSSLSKVRLDIFLDKMSLQAYPLEPLEFCEIMDSKFQ